MLGKIEINMNQTVKVKLTKEAMERKEKEIAEFNQRFDDDVKLKIDEDGYYHDQLWGIIQDFGDMISFCYSPIEDCKIIIEY